MNSLKTKTIKLGNSDKSCLVDYDDHDDLSKFSWYEQGGYARTTVNKPRRKNMSMHRYLMNAPKGKQVDHINGNRLDNRRCNLRLCDPSENLMNSRKRSGASSLYKGVFQGPSGRWQVYCGKGNENRYKGTYDTEIEAAKAYDRFASALFGKYAKLNFPSGDDGGEA